MSTDLLRESGEQHTFRGGYPQPLRKGRVDNRVAGTRVQNRIDCFARDLNFQNDALFFASVWTFKHNLIISALINMFVSFVYYSSYS